MTAHSYTHEYGVHPTNNGVTRTTITLVNNNHISDTIFSKATAFGTPEGVAVDSMVTPQDCKDCTMRTKSCLALTCQGVKFNVPILEEHTNTRRLCLRFLIACYQRQAIPPLDCDIPPATFGELKAK